MYNSIDLFKGGLHKFYMKKYFSKILRPEKNFQFTRVMLHCLFLCLPVMATYKLFLLEYLKGLISKFYFQTNPIKYLNQT